MKKTILAMAVLMCAAVAGHAQEAGQDFEKTIPAIQPIPDAIRQPAAQQGTIEEFKYTAVRRGQEMPRHARVYLPYGYDKQKKYNVLYLMHGGGDNTTSFLTPPHDWLPLCQVLDHLIAEGKMKPVIVVCPTFYDDDENIGANRMEDATLMCANFYQELQKYLIPTVEKAYSTYLEGTDSLSIDATREHRAFGGFSMGALCTWYTLANAVNSVKYFLPLSGDIWMLDDNGKRKPAEDAAMMAEEAAMWMNTMLERSPYGKDFEVWGWTGTKDIAGTPERNAMKALSKKAPLFRYGNEPGDNLHFAMREGGEHFYGHINEYLWFALPLIWK